MKATSTFSLKDQLFNPEKVAFLAGLVTNAYPSFASDAFQKDVVTAFPSLELKERITHMAECLHKYLPASYMSSIDILLRSLPPELDPAKTDDDFGDFIFSPLALFVATYGCTAEHLDLSLKTLKEMTKRFSVEYAIRFFINAFPEETLVYLSDWSHDENYHVRRLTSEGTRPKLPWAQKLNIDFTSPLPILETLHSDPTRYVTRSVANHLNDISKLDPDLVIRTLKRWQQGKQQEEKEMAFIAKHSLRTLVKKGDANALGLLGFGGKPDISIEAFDIHTPVVKIGDALEFSFALHANKEQNLVVDYLMTFATSGKKAGQKVFKIKELELTKGQVVKIKKKHPMRLMTTRRLYTGEHSIMLQVNGQDYGSLTFELTE
ncbi:MAG: DNA alkylation repair protein [Rhodothermales bacterium]